MRRAILIIQLMVFSLFASAQFDLGGKIKNKVDQKVNEKADKAIDEGLDEAEGKNSKKEKESGTKSDSGNEESAGEGTENAPAETKTNIKSYSKFDYVPGNNVLYVEDFSNDNIGDFPDNWNTNGSGEIVTLDRQPGKWLQLAGHACYIAEMKNTLPENFTYEFDLIPTVKTDGSLGSFDIVFTQEKEATLDVNPYVGEGGVHLLLHTTSWYFEGWSHADGQRVSGTSDKKPIYDNLNKVLHFAFWFQKQRVRVYINDEKVFDLPKVLKPGIKVNTFKIHTNVHEDQEARVYINNFRAAEATADMRSKLMTEGSFSTSGIMFDTNSDVIKSESYGIVREIANMMKEDQTLKLRITGHTDNTGKDETNLELSKRRAESVKKLLQTQYGIDASRLETDGKGAKAQVAANDTPENKAKNRRVEFQKL